MTPEQEKKLAWMAEQEAQAKCQQSCQQGALGSERVDRVMGLDADRISKRPGLRHRISERLDCAHQESRKADRLEELQHLLAKNPELARILDLLEELQ